MLEVVFKNLSKDHVQSYFTLLNVIEFPSVLASLMSDKLENQESWTLCIMGYISNSTGHVITGEPPCINKRKLID